ncbi:MAG TPA: hypothetical protein PLC99_24690 [Verrucomicrobiota bacterium]|nr:hypothetical protein [Verrucomicrobiota bacterium]
MRVGQPGWWVMVFVLLWAGAEGARAACEAPFCCFYLPEGWAIAQAEVTAVDASQLSISLLGTPVYCSGGIECSPADFPVELSLEPNPDGCGCGNCEGLAVGDVGLFFVVKSLGCLNRVVRVEDAGVICNRSQSVPVEFVLENALSPTCEDAFVEAGYFDRECDDTLESCAGCAQAGQGGGLLLAVVVGLGILRSKRTARAHG